MFEYVWVPANVTSVVVFARRAPWCEFGRGLFRRGQGTDDFDSCGRDFDLSPRVAIAVELLVELFVTRREVAIVGESNIEGGFDAAVAHVERASRSADVFGGHAVGEHLPVSMLFEVTPNRFELSESVEANDGCRTDRSP